MGVTNLDPMTLMTSLPKTATDLRRGTTVMVTGGSVAVNGKEIQKISHNIHNTQVGATI